MMDSKLLEGLYFLWLVGFLALGGLAAGLEILWLEWRRRRKEIFLPNKEVNKYSPGCFMIVKGDRNGD